MKIIFYTPEYEESFEANIPNLVQLYDYLRVNKPKIFKEISTKELCYSLYDENKEKAFPILPTMLDFDFSEYPILVICPKLEGEALFTTIATTIATAVTAAVAAAGATAVVATVVGYAVATIVTIGLVIGLGMLIKSLTPQNKLDNNQDPSQLSKLFNGVPTITEQGGSVPVVFGNCLFGGVRIGLRLEQTLPVYTDVIPVHTFAEGMNYPSNWMRFV